MNENEGEGLGFGKSNEPKPSRLGKLGFGLSLLPVVALALLFLLRPG